MLNHKPRWIRLLLARCASVWLCLAIAGPLFAAEPRPTGPWKLESLLETPAAEWGEQQGLLQTVYYAGEPFAGKPTRVFAYVGRPAEGKGPFPAMVLVHGGGGKAFSAWAEHWAKRGYVAIAMDLAGHGPDGRLPDGGPDQGDDNKFRDFTDADRHDMWTYHAVAAVLRGHSLLASLPEVDRERIGVTGISWGGYLTSIVAGIDPRLKVAVPVYGCGFLHENSVWTANILAKMTPERQARWVKNFDPSQYLPGVTCPILFLNGTNDFAYPPDSYRKSYSLVKEAPVTVSFQVRLPHGHIWTFPEVDHFVDHHLRKTAPFPVLEPSALSEDKQTATAKFSAEKQVTAAHLHYTHDTGPWQQRTWHSIGAEVGDGVITAKIPDLRPIVFYLAVTEGDRQIQVSNPYLEVAP